MRAFLAVHVFWVVCLIGLSEVSLLQATSSSSGFTLDLIHRDSPLSPLYNPNDSHLDRLRKSFHRSLSRINHFRPNSSGYAADKLFGESRIVPSGGEYLMKIFIGTPPVELFSIADTGSDLIWVQCQPCDMCYKQKSPIFDPRQSSSYHHVSCGTSFCNALDTDMRACVQGSRKTTCGYTYSYGDHSFTEGDLGTESFVVGSLNATKRPVSLARLAFGCGTRNGGTFDESGSGIVGLGGGTLSLVSQLGEKIGGKFSYCLVPAVEGSNTTGRLSFGTDSNSTISGSGHTVSTPLVAKEPDTYFYLTLEAISVGEKRLAYKDSWNGSVKKGNIIIDSGTTLTFLDSEFFNELESAMEEAVDIKRVSDPQGLFSMCFKEARELDLPIITFHFTDADVKLHPVNTFAKVEGDLLCFTMIASNDIAIFGNLSQMDFEVGYDLEKRRVSFKPTDCAK